MLLTDQIPRGWSTVKVLCKFLQFTACNHHALILKILGLRTQSLCYTNKFVICVTRFYGGVKLMGDRFKHIQDVTKYAITQALD